MLRHHLTRLAVLGMLVGSLSGCWAPGGGVPNTCLGHGDGAAPTRITLTQGPGSEPGTTQWNGQVNACLRGHGDPSDTFVVTMPAGTSQFLVTCSASAENRAQFDIASTVVGFPDTGCADPGYTSGAGIGALAGTDATITVEPGPTFEGHDVPYELVITAVL